MDLLTGKPGSPGISAYIIQLHPAIVNWKRFKFDTKIAVALPFGEGAPVGGGRGLPSPLGRGTACGGRGFAASPPSSGAARHLPQRGRLIAASPPSSLRCAPPSPRGKAYCGFAALFLTLRATFPKGEGLLRLRRPLPYAARHLPQRGRLIAVSPPSSLRCVPPSPEGKALCGFAALFLTMRATWR